MNAASVTPVPMACSLDSDSLSSRLGRIARLAQHHLQSERRDGRSLQLRYAHAAGAELRSIVELERQCCPFLAFDLTEEDDAVELSITWPSDAGASAASIYDHFRGAAPALAARSCAGSGCGCAV